MAQYIVTQQATHDDATGAEKKAAATAALLAQVKKSKTKITFETAKGMIEKAYTETQKGDENTSIDDIQCFAEDDEEQPVDNPMTNTPTDSVETDGTDSNDKSAKAKTEAEFAYKKAVEFGLPKGTYLAVDWENGSGNYIYCGISSSTSAILAAMAVIKSNGYVPLFYSGVSAMRNQEASSRLIATA